MALLGGGDWINDHLQTDRLLGEGAYAEVHRVKHRYLGFQAMKLFKRVGSEERVQAMLEEARLLSKLGHANIIRVFDAGTVSTPEGLRGFFTMEYIGGGSLEKLARGYRGTVPTDLVVEVVTQLANGLAAAHVHEPPIVHRDVTLANVLVGYEEHGMRVRVSDFGLAKRADPFTHLASAQGTYAFMAPEVLRNQGYSCASDVWSVGTIAYWLLTNHFPYDDGGPFSSYSVARFRQRLLPPSKYNDEVDPELDRIVLAALELDPSNRPATAGALFAAFRDRRRPSTTESETTRPIEGGVGTRARRLVAEAHALSRVPGQLSRAADLLEEAINLEPGIRKSHLYRLLLWRRGVIL